MKTRELEKFIEKKLKDEGNYYMTIGTLIVDDRGYRSVEERDFQKQDMRFYPIYFDGPEAGNLLIGYESVAEFLDEFGYLFDD